MCFIYDAVPAFPLFCWFQYAGIINLSIAQCNRIAFFDKSYFNHIACAHSSSVFDKVISHFDLLQTHFVCTAGKVGLEKLHRAIFPTTDITDVIFCSMGLAAYWAGNRFCHDCASPFLLYKRYSHTAPEGSAVYPCGCTGSILCNEYSAGRCKIQWKIRNDLILYAVA